MKTKVLIFGQLVELVGSNELELTGYNNTASLIEVLHQKFPGLQQSKYIIALDQQIISKNMNLTENSIVALLPPFSGG